MKQAGLMQIAGVVLARELKLAVRRWDQVLQPVLFFVIVTALFPLASANPDAAHLQQIGPGVVWVAAMLGSLLSIESLFKPDLEDGTLEQWVLSGQPLPWLLLFKTVAHWVLSGVPLIVLSPMMATGFGIPNHALGWVMASLALGTAILSVFGAVGAALTVGVRRGNVLVALLVLPLEVPTLIFGAYAVEQAIRGESTAGPMYLLGAILVFAITLGPFAMASAVRIGVES